VTGAVLDSSSTRPADGSWAYSLTTLVRTGSVSTMMPTSRWAKPGSPFPHPMQKPG
jgi:hypothetical protein